MGDVQVPDQPDGIESESFDLPTPVDAAARVGDFLEWFGDGRVVTDCEESGDFAPLYARDLQALVNNTGHRDLLLWRHAEAEWRRSQLDDEALKWTEVAGRHSEEIEQLQFVLRMERQVADSMTVEIGRLRREVEFEAHGERWSNSIVGRPGHEYVNGHRACACGVECLTIGSWERHLLQSRIDAGKPLCACVTAEQAAALPAGVSRPVCTVHPVLDVGFMSLPQDFQDAALLAGAEARSAADDGSRISLEDAAAAFGVDMSDDSGSLSVLPEETPGGAE